MIIIIEFWWMDSDQEVKWQVSALGFDLIVSSAVIMTCTSILEKESMWSDPYMCVQYYSSSSTWYIIPRNQKDRDQGWMHWNFDSYMQMIKVIEMTLDFLSLSISSSWLDLFNAFINAMLKKSIDDDNDENRIKN